MGLKKYMDQWRIMLWDSAFHASFKTKDAISKSKLWKDQEGGESALKRLILRWLFISQPKFNFLSLSIYICIFSLYFFNVFRYWKHVLVPAGAVQDDLPFFLIWTDIATPSHIFTAHQLQLWSLPHLQSCAWYIECPKDKTPSSEQDLRLSIENTTPTPSRVQTILSADDDVVVLGDTLNAIGIQDASIQSSQQFSHDDVDVRPTQCTRKHPRDVPTKETTPLQPPSKSRRFLASSKHSPSSSSIIHRHAQTHRPHLISRDHNFLACELLLNDTVANMQKIFKTTKQWPSTYHEMSSFLDKVIFIYF